MTPDDAFDSAVRETMQWRSRWLRMRRYVKRALRETSSLYETLLKDLLDEMDRLERSKRTRP